ncbi:DUF4270 domain-containing protein [Salegentibacter sp. F188]|uniref:DUF4270 domain-containing protein n=1 Tax=Autumnicola patrickiae TaxID=3075591 RepID=A0ABU3E445_9FLAO|nr:DUF4270 domain-containing protein [Salegentibacter sp. F188]MDT0690754.1 DUF4270 domain-containing protein [Salegentibacter sp. F188]
MNFERVTLKIATALVVIFCFIACDEDYSDIGGEVIGNPTEVDYREVDVTAWSRKIKSVQTNILPNHLLGAYHNEIYGLTEASILAQVSLANGNPTFGDEPVLDSVVLNIPFFSQAVEDAEHQYKLDSIYGNAPFKISVYESGYYLNNLDPGSNFEQRQKYYSDQQELFEQYIQGDTLYQNGNYRPSAQPIVSYEPTAGGVESDTVVSPPALRMKLPVEFFQQKILDKQGASELANNDNFRNYLRGLFIKAEAVNNDGSMMLLNLAASGAGITLYYKYDRAPTNEEEETTRARRSFKLNFGNNVVNTFEGEYPDEVLQAIQSSGSQGGAENLYIKGAEGSMAIITLFSDAAELEELKQNNWLVNEANLNFYVNQDMTEGVNEPERIYLYDLNNNRRLIDYTYDTGGSNTNPLNSVTSHSTRLERDEDGSGVKYTLRITQHVNNILNKDSTNVRLGLVVTPNINITANAAVRGSENDTINRVPLTSALTPLGTVLHGNRSEDEEKRLKLRIYYTETNE